MAETTRTGHCLCGAIRITIPVAGASAQTHVDVCHCDICRRWSGGPMMAIDGGKQVQFEGEENIAVYASSEWADRGFCNKCGSNLFYRLKEQQHYFFMADLFDQDDTKQLKQQLFIDEKPAYYSFANDTRNLTGEELFAQFNASKE